MNKLKRLRKLELSVRLLLPDASKDKATSDNGTFEIKLKTSLD
jgi:hypothetical protein